MIWEDEVHKTYALLKLRFFVMKPPEMINKHNSLLSSISYSFKVNTENWKVSPYNKCNHFIHVGEAFSSYVDILQLKEQQLIQRYVSRPLRWGT